MIALRSCLRIRPRSFTGTTAVTLLPNKIIRANNKWFSTSSTKCKVDLNSLGHFEVWVSQDHRNVPHEEPESDETNMEVLKRGIIGMPGECRKFVDEITDDIGGPPLYQNGDLLKLFDFSKEEVLKSFTVSTDADFHIGYSKADFVTSSNNTGLFSGNIDLTLPGDGVTTNTGYCNVCSPRRIRSFYRNSRYDECRCFTHLVLRLRGDGRTYMIILDMSEDMIDLTWGDKHMYYLHTRGGPHWQTTFIPFNYFIRMNRGALQDMQFPVQSINIKNIGITAAKVEGHFRLEMDYIGLYLHGQKTPYPYEMYYYNHPRN